MFEYSGWLRASLDEEQQARVEQLASSFGLRVDACDSQVEFEYQGRDANRFVVRFLAGLADVLGHAEGEIRCEHDTGALDPVLEFFKIHSGQRLQQRGRIERSPGRRSLMTRCPKRRRPIAQPLQRRAPAHPIG